MNNLYNQSKWARWYLELCHSRQKLGRKKLPKSHPDYVYYESHHIVPRRLGGSNDKANLVLLSPREHIWAHILLVKALSKEHHKQIMRLAVNRMKAKLLKFVDGKEFFDSRAYELVRVEHARLGMSEDTKQKLRKPKSEEAKRNYPAAASRRRWTDEQRAEMSRRRRGKPQRKRGPLPEWHLEKLREAGKNVILTAEQRSKISTKKSTSFSFISPEGEVITGVGLSKFCKERGLSQGSMSLVRMGKQDSYKNWRLA